MKWIKKAALIIIFILFITGLASYVFQNRLIFQAKKLPSEHHFAFDQPYEEYFISTPDNNTLNVLWFKPPQKAKGLVIYFHGNADHLQRWGKYASDITQQGYEVLMMDYRGYGKSSGSPDEETLYADAALVYNWAKDKTMDEDIILYGRSMGAAIATHLAAQIQPKLLILETPFDELKGASVLQYLSSIVPLRTKFITKEFIDEVKGKIIIFHGTNDWVVSLKSAERLKPFLKETDEFIVIQGGSHNNLREYDKYHSTLASALQ